MRDWHLPEGAITERNSLAICSRGTANAKGSYVQVVASTAFAYDALLVQIFQDSASGGAQCFLLDISIGGAGSEVVVVPNLLLDSMRNTGTADVSLYIPLQIPAGSRIAARCQEAGGAGTRNACVQVTGVAGGWNNIRPCAGSVIAYGVDTGTTNGTLVDQGASANTFGSWAQLTSGTSQDHRWLGLCLGFDKQTVAPSQANGELEIGIGSAGSEVAIAKHSFAVQSFATAVRPSCLGIFVQIPTGTRLAARFKSTAAAAADRHLTAALYGA